MYSTLIVVARNLYSRTLSHLVTKGINQSFDILHDLFIYIHSCVNVD